MSSLQSSAAIEWGINPRFLRYVGRLADGVCRVGGGVTTTPSGGFLFPASATAEECSGYVEISGHARRLRVWLARPAVAVEGEAIGLTVEVDPLGRRAAIADLSPVGLGDLPDDGAAEGPAIFVATLREEGVDVFGGVYPVGHPLAPVLLHPVLTATAGR